MRSFSRSHTPEIQRCADADAFIDRLREKNDDRIRFQPIVSRMHFLRQGQITIRHIPRSCQRNEEGCSSISERAIRLPFPCPSLHPVRLEQIPYQRQLDPRTNTATIISGTLIDPSRPAE